MRKNKLLLLVFSLIVLVSCSVTRFPLELGKKVPSNIIIKGNIVTPTGKIIDRAIFVYQNREFEIGLSNDSMVLFISTTDLSFKVKNIGVGSRYSDMRANSDIITIPEWGYYVPINKKWYAGFYARSFAGFYFSDTLSKDSEVLKLFQYDFYSNNNDNKKFIQEGDTSAIYRW